MTERHMIPALCAALAVAFLYYGLRKLGSFPAEVAIYEAIGFGQFPRYVTGSVEVLGAVLLFVRGWRGVAGLMLMLTICVGLTALLLWVGPPYWHMFLLIAGSGIVARVCREDIRSKLPQAS